MCPSKFGENEDLKNHIKSVHKTIKKFYCDICQSSFVDILILKRHIKPVHKKIKDTKCIVCIRAFGCNGHQRHLKAAVHEKREKEYQCNICNKMYAQNETLQSHIKILN